MNDVQEEGSRTLDHTRSGLSLRVLAGVVGCVIACCGMAIASLSALDIFLEYLFSFLGQVFRGQGRAKINRNGRGSIMTTATMPLVEPETFPLTWEFALRLVLILFPYLAAACPCMLCCWVILRWWLHHFQAGGWGFVEEVLNPAPAPEFLYEVSLTRVVRYMAFADIVIISALPVARLQKVNSWILGHVHSKRISFHANGLNVSTYYTVR
jgi:hypothetical protein